MDILDILFPSFCLGCKKEGSYLCEDCKAILDILETRYCLCEESPSRLKDKGKCGKCSSKNLSGLYYPLFLKERALSRKLIHYFKDDPYYLKDLAKTLALLLIDHFFLIEEDLNNIFKNSVIVPVLQEKKEIKCRGYNQAEEIAKELSKILSVPLLENKKIPKLRGFSKKVFLVDDVYTDNSKMEEYAKSLRETGVKEIWGLAIARN